MKEENIVRIGVYKMDPLLLLRQQFKSDADAVLILCSELKELVPKSIKVLVMADEHTRDHWLSREEEIYRLFQELYKITDMLNEMADECEKLWHQAWDVSE